MEKKSFALFVLLVFLFSTTSCKKIIKKPVIDNSFHEIGKITTLDNSSEITVQDVIVSPEFKLQTTTDGVQNFPFIYLKKENSKKDNTGPRIIKIEKDGSTIDTLVDTVQSKSYSSAYIVEIGGDLNKTIARYVLDTKKDLIRPKSTSDQFIFVTFIFKNNTRKSIITKDFSLFIELPDKNKIEFDTILAETILSNTIPKEIKSGESSSIRYVGVIPINSKEITITFEGKKFKWENKDIKATK